MAASEESLVFAKIVRYVAQQIEDVAAADDPGAAGGYAAVLAELADAFEYTGGFKYSYEQSRHLVEVFALLEGAMHNLAHQATRLEQHNAAAKMQWAAGQAGEMRSEVQRRHDDGEGGVVAFVGEDDGAPN
ncbi:MAG: hypothetical protein H6907_12555 [Hyphomicrobiales bacterium]|nr:hypothetical protein [Hyphomicrobiales bacterium]MCP5372553.1 hypothetical protein [Hyphomicrobiales bacterium]